MEKEEERMMIRNARVLPSKTMFVRVTNSEAVTRGSLCLASEIKASGCPFTAIDLVKNCMFLACEEVSPDKVKI